MPASGHYPKAVEGLAAWFRRLPGIGRRTAERLALALLEWTEEDLQAFAASVASLKERVHACAVCGNLSDERLCRLCTSAERDRALICVVESASQIPCIEAAGCFRGLYHVLGGRLVPLAGIGPEKLRLEQLRRRLAEGQVSEVILATSPDVEGEATASFLAAELSRPGVRFTRIAAGVPVGADLTFADAATMAMAISGRREFD